MCPPSSSPRVKGETERKKAEGTAATVITALMIAYKELRYDPIHVVPGADKVIFFWFPPWRIKFGSRVNRVG